MVLIFWRSFCTVVNTGPFLFLNEPDWINLSSLLKLIWDLCMSSSSYHDIASSFSVFKTLQFYRPVQGRAKLNSFVFIAFGETNVFLCGWNLGARFKVHWFLFFSFFYFCFVLSLLLSPSREQLFLCDVEIIVLYLKHKKPLRAFLFSVCLCCMSVLLFSLHECELFSYWCPAVHGHWWILLNTVRTAELQGVINDRSGWNLSS